METSLRNGSSDCDRSRLIIALDRVLNSVASISNEIAACNELGTSCPKSPMIQQERVISWRYKAQF